MGRGRSRGRKGGKGKERAGFKPPTEYLSQDEMRRAISSTLMQRMNELYLPASDVEVIIPDAMLVQLKYINHAVDGEWGCFGTWEWESVDGKMAIVLNDMCLPERQYCSGGSFTPDQIELLEYIETAFLEGEERKFWWYHSHVNMQTNPSGTDERTIANLVNNTLNNHSWLVTIIGRKGTTKHSGTHDWHVRLDRTVDGVPLRVKGKVGREHEMLNDQAKAELDRYVAESIKDIGSEMDDKIAEWEEQVKAGGRLAESAAAMLKKVEKLQKYEREKEKEEVTARFEPTSIQERVRKARGEGLESSAPSYFKRGRIGTPMELMSEGFQEADDVDIDPTDDGLVIEVDAEDDGVCKVMDCCRKLTGAREVESGLCYICVWLVAKASIDNAGVA